MSIVNDINWKHWTSEQAGEQAQVTYEKYKKIKSFQDVGYLLTYYVVSGGEVSKNIKRNDMIDVTDIVASLDNNILSRDGTSFETQIPDTIYYLDFDKTGEWHWGTAHAPGVAGEDYLTIAAVFTDAAGVVSLTDDMRGHVGGMRLKDEYGLEDYAKKVEIDEQFAETEHQLEGKTDVIETEKLKTLTDKTYFKDNLNTSGARPCQTIFHITGNMSAQGLEFVNNHFYISGTFNDGGIIYQLDRKGKMIKSTSKIMTGHSNDLAYRISNNRFYVVNGARDLTHVYEINMEAPEPAILSDWDLEYLGESGAIAIDNDNDLFVIHTRDDNVNSKHKFTFFDGDKQQLKQFEINKVGTCQGLTIHKGLIYFLTSTPTTQPTITVMDFEGNILSRQSYTVYKTDGTSEAQGVAIAWQGAIPYLAMGYHGSGIKKVVAIRSPENTSIYNNILPIHTVSRKNTDESLMPRIFTCRINKSSGEWALSTENHYFDSNNFVESITVVDGFININLKEYFAAVGFTSAQPDMTSILQGALIVAEIYDGANNVIRIRIVDIATKTLLNPNNLASNWGGIKVMVYGAIKTTTLS